jgi:hypothetical protein
MPAENDFLIWAPSGGNVISQAGYAASAFLANGVVTGLADPTLYNKSARQASLMANMLAQFIIDEINADVIDTGVITTLLANFKAALRVLFDNAFSHSIVSGGLIHTFPDGIIDLSFTTLINFSGAGYFGNTVTYPVAFPHNTFDIMTSYSGTTPPLGGVTVSAEPIDRFTCQLTTNSTGFGVSGVVAMNVRVRGN